LTSDAVLRPNDRNWNPISPRPRGGHRDRHRARGRTTAPVVPVRRQPRRSDYVHVRGVGARPGGVRRVTRPGAAREPRRSARGVTASV